MTSTLKTVNPATEETIDTYKTMSDEEMRAAIELEERRYRRERSETSTLQPRLAPPCGCLLYTSPSPRD